MTNLIDWAPNLSIGIQSFDTEHKKLVGYLNELNSAMMAGSGKAACERILTGLISYTKTHFANEERIFDLYHYPDAEAHKQEHVNLIREVGSFYERFQRNEVALSVSLLQFLESWLKNHIQVTDKKYGVFLNAKGLR